MTADRPHARALAPLFLAALSDVARARLGAPADLETALAAIRAAARAAWPEIEVSDTSFVAFLARRCESLLGEAGPDPPREVTACLGGLRAADLYLVCAYLEGDRRAIAAMERSLAQVAETLRRMRLDEPAIEDIVQGLHLRLLAERDAGAATYSGRGELQGWLRVAAIRKGYDLLARGVTERAEADPEPASVDLAERDAELAWLKRRYRAEFSAAFADAFAALGSRQRNLLRYYLVDEMNIDQIGAIYRVHRATVARWIADTRARLLDGTREALERRFHIDPAEFDSLLRAVRSQLYVNVRELLGGDGGD